jgi:hypothetical protein
VRVPPFRPQLDTDQEMMSQDTLGHVMVPAEPRANHILIHAQLVFAVFQGGFDSLYANGEKVHADRRA